MSAIHDGFKDRSYEPVATTFFGYRAFQICPSGALSIPIEGVPQTVIPRGLGIERRTRGAITGIFKTEFQWGAGVNEAECLVGTGVRPRLPAATSTHRLMDPACSCGFWAYTNGRHTLSVQGSATVGIIEGWGKMVLGPDGFRAQKARIRALAFPPFVEESDPEGNIEAVGHAASDAMLRVARSFRLAINRAFGQPEPADALGPIRSARPWEGIDPALRDAVTRAYPDVALFGSVVDMVKAFPLSDLSGLLAEPEVESVESD